MNQDAIAFLIIFAVSLGSGWLALHYLNKRNF